ncbi:sulfite exporter TauE/SafE family protein [Rhodococcus sp. H36-A4]|uniref:sulfite exporter TauE/SafE family protein n=1 Tax=Rhodococcus sp. H36-A4 TaxID=3004353 RepID=UPI0022AF593F|nr:sulfite exporter TauE/SafE family protein [Rhodococcus sp. H36-A4]MCZ4080465.1 sulfite exporter TauE/SafE family protein [Rhodococcus sp. H36-A4]
MTMVVAAMLCMGVASIIGGATGFGTSLIATPLMLIAGIGVPEIVVVNLIVGLVTRVAVAYQLRAHIDWLRVALIGGASLPGAWLGVFTVNMLPEQYLKPAAGVITMLCGLVMALPLAKDPKPPSRAANVMVGSIGGYLSTTTSLNGPPVVLLLSRAKLPPMSFIADLAGYFVVTNTLSLALLWGYTDVQPVAMLPMILGCIASGMLFNWVGMSIAKRLSVRTFRSATVVLVVIAGALTIATA